MAPRLWKAPRQQHMLALSLKIKVRSLRPSLNEMLILAQDRRKWKSAIAGRSVAAVLKLSKKQMYRTNRTHL